MAKAPAVSNPEQKALAGLSDEACDRLDGCERQKREYELDIRESYFFAAPHRAREIFSNQPPSESKRQDAGERNTSIASELSRDFVTEVMGAFMPQSEPWAEQRPGMFLPDEIKKQAEDEVAKQDPVIFDAIRASNLYEIAPMAFAPDLPVGLTGLWIDDPRPAENIVCQPIPIAEIECNVGPYGQLDDRFAVRWTRNRHVRALLGDEIFGKLPADVKRTITEKPKERTCLRWGFWRLWERRDDICWQHVVMVDKKVVHEAKLVGEGSCPMLVMRFNPSPEWACGNGPLIESLEDLRMLDALEADKIDSIELRLRPPTAFPDDSFTSVEDGIETGSAYPVRPGSEGAIKPIFEGGDIEAALFEVKDIIERLQRKFFIGFPRQRGDTPPTATQWLDEMQEAQRRIGTPGMSFWREGPAEIFLRYKYLLTQRRVIEPIKVNGKIIALTPYNPAQRAAEQQEVHMAARFFSIVAPTFPEEFRLSVDGNTTMVNIQKKMRANLVAFRTEQQKAQALAQISQLIEGRQQVRPGDPAQAGQL